MANIAISVFIFPCNKFRIVKTDESVWAFLPLSLPQYYVHAFTILLSERPILCVNMFNNRAFSVCSFYLAFNFRIEKNMDRKHATCSACYHTTDSCYYAQTYSLY